MRKDEIGVPFSVLEREEQKNRQSQSPTVIDHSQGAGILRRYLLNRIV
jgi:hypothetical protein